MQLTDTLASLLRRWYVVVIGVVLTVAVGWATYKMLPARYDASASVVVMPAASIVGADGNPYLYLNGMNDAMDVLIRRTNSTEVQKDLLADLEGASYSIVRDAMTTSPIFVITVEAKSEADTLGLLNAAITASKDNLSTMQEDLSIPEERRISLRAVAVDEQATRDSKAPLQVGLVVIGAGLFGTIMAAGMIDGFMLRRQRDADGGDVIPTADPGAGLPPTTAPADQDVRASDSRDWPFAPQVSGLVEVSPQPRSAEVDHDLETQRQ